MKEPLFYLFICSLMAYAGLAACSKNDKNAAPEIDFEHLVSREQVAQMFASEQLLFEIEHFHFS